MNLRARGQHDIGGERQIGAGAGGDPVDGGDHRHRQGGDPADHQVVVTLDRDAEIDAVGDLAQGRVGQVLAGANRGRHR